MPGKVVGILGGMGPESTAELFLKVIHATPIACEQDHLRVVIDSNPAVPDRTEALLSGDTEPVVAALVATARNLERAGAELIAMPCNTAHAFLTEIRASVAVPVLDMVDEAAQRARRLFGGGKLIGLLATDGARRARIYQVALERHGLSAATPDGDAQRSVMEAIAQVKLHGVSDPSREALSPAIRELADQGAAALIAGCTEISLLLAHRAPDLPWLDPLQVLAERLVAEALAPGARR